MDELLAREMVVLTGKGGVGRTTIAAAIGRLASERGLSTVVVEVGEQARVPALLGARPGRPGVPLRLDRNLAALTIDPDRALLRWLQQVGGRAAGRLLASSSTFQYFAAAAPGARELTAMVAIWQLTASAGGRGEHFDLVVVDGPASGHALGMLRSPTTFGSIARVGPIAAQSREVELLVSDASRSGYVLVTLPSDMAVAETLDFGDEFAAQLGRPVELVIVNQLLPRRFTNHELERARAARLRGAAGAAIRAAGELEHRARAQHSHVQRLRRHHLDAATVPFLWRDAIDAEAVGWIAGHLSHRLAPS